MVNNIDFAKREEKTLDEWVNDLISQIEEIAYTVMLEINQELMRIANYVR